MKDVSFLFQASYYMNFHAGKTIYEYKYRHFFYFSNFILIY